MSSTMNHSSSSPIVHYGTGRLPSYGPLAQVDVRTGVLCGVWSSMRRAARTANVARGVIIHSIKRGAIPLMNGPSSTSSTSLYRWLPLATYLDEERAAGRALPPAASPFTDSDQLVCIERSSGKRHGPMSLKRAASCAGNVDPLFVKYKVDVAGWDFELAKGREQEDEEFSIHSEGQDSTTESSLVDASPDTSRMARAFDDHVKAQAECRKAEERRQRSEASFRSEAADLMLERANQLVRTLPLAERYAALSALQEHLESAIQELAVRFYYEDFLTKSCTSLESFDKPPAILFISAAIHHREYAGEKWRAIPSVPLLAASNVGRVRIGSTILMPYIGSVPSSDERGCFVYFGNLWRRVALLVAETFPEQIKGAVPTNTLGKINVNEMLRDDPANLVWK